MAWLVLALVATRRKRSNSAKEDPRVALEDRGQVLLELEVPIGTVILILGLEAIPIGEVEIGPPIITTLNTIVIIRIAHRWLLRNTITIIFSTHRSNTINNRRHGVQRRTME